MPTQAPRAENAQTVQAEDRGQEANNVVARTTQEAQHTLVIHPDRVAVLDPVTRPDQGKDFTLLPPQSRAHHFQITECSPLLKSTMGR